MAAPQPPQDPGVHNTFRGQADAVVQAGQVYGGVHFHTRRRWGILAGVAGGIAALLFTGFVAPGFLISGETPADENSSAESNRPASETGGGRYHTNHILKDNPYDAVRQVYRRIADNSPAFACGAFTDEAAQQFAEHFDAADCPVVVAKLNRKVDTSPGSLNAYAEPDFHGRMGTVPTEDSITISSCEIGVTAGPRLGSFTVSRVEMGQWIITGHRSESC
jgi:hypothetical protein